MVSVSAQLQLTNKHLIFIILNNLVLRHRDHCSRHVETAYVSVMHHCSRHVETAHVSVMHRLSHSTHSARTLALYIESTITPTLGVPDGPQ